MPDRGLELQKEVLVLRVVLGFEQVITCKGADALLRFPELSDTA